MKTIISLTILNGILAAVSAYLISQMSFIGKLGIGLFYNQYKVLKSPIETGLIIFALQMAVILLLFILYQFSSKKITRIVAVIIIIIAVAAWGFTIYDFTYEFSHKILKTKFHIGFYLIWFGTIISALTYLIKTGKKIAENEIEK